MARGAAYRRVFRKIYKRLVLARDKRVAKKRKWAATKMQGMYRIFKAFRITAVKKREFEDREVKRRQLEELENKLESIHSGHMTDLLAIRIQGGSRVHLAKRLTNIYNSLICAKLYISQ